MRTVPWLRRAGWLGAVALLMPTSTSLRADETAAPVQVADAAEAAPKAEAAKEAAPAKDAKLAGEPASPAVPASPESPRAPRPPRPPKPVRPAIAMRHAKFRINAHLAPVPKPLDSQLDLKGEGVVIAHVMPEGPAAKAGLKDDDIVVAVGDKRITKPNDLTDAVEGSDGKELSLHVIRGGKPVVIALTPDKNAELSPKSFRFEHGIDIDVENLESLENLEKNISEKLKKAGVDLRMQLIGPGKTIDAEKLFLHRAEFPDDLSVTIRKKGKEPAEVEVKKGDKSWNVKDTELAQLPDDVRRPVETLLGRAVVHMRVVGPGGQPGPNVKPYIHLLQKNRPGGPDGPPEGPAGPGRHGPPGPPPGVGRGGDHEGPPPGPAGERADRGAPRARRPGPPERSPQSRDRLERRLDALSEHMNRLREQLDGLRDSLRDNEREEEEEIEIETR
jgi:PDZ domain